MSPNRMVVGTTSSYLSVSSPPTIIFLDEIISMDVRVNVDERFPRGGTVNHDLI